MKHLFISESDYANGGELLAKSLRAIGHEAQTYVRRASVLHYPEQGTEWRRKSPWIIEIPKLLQWCDWLHVVQSELPASMGGRYPVPTPNPERERFLAGFDKPVALLHGGGYYRGHHRAFQRVWSELVKINVCFSADLMFGYVNEHLLLPPVNDPYMGEFEAHEGRLVIGHFPSRPQDKGTSMIHPLLSRLSSELGFEYRSANLNPGEVRQNRLPWLEHIARMKECDVIIDQIAAVVGGLAVGEWVSNATEAAALGCITITNSRRPEPYIDTYGERPHLWICNDSAALERAVRKLSAMTRAEIEAEREAARRWAERRHFLEPTGRLYSRLLKDAA